MTANVQDPTARILAEVKRLRRAHGWTQPELAVLCQQQGLSWDRSIIANAEGGRRASVTAFEVLVLAEVFGVTPMSLLDGRPCCEADRILRQVRQAVDR